MVAARNQVTVRRVSPVAALQGNVVAFGYILCHEYAQSPPSHIS